MGIKNLKKAFVTFLIFSAVLPMLFSSSAAALSFSYQDNVLGNFSITSNQNATKPNGVVTVTVLCMLPSSASAPIVLHIIFQVDTAAQSAKVLNEQDMIVDSKTTFKSSITQIVVPSDAVNGAYVYATVTNGTITFSKIAVTLVQAPSYAELQTQVNLLNASLISQQANNTALLINNTNLQNQLATLQTDYDALLVNCSNLQNNLATLINQSSSLSANNTELQNQLATVLAEKETLQTQLSNLQANLTSLQTQLSTAIANSSSYASQVTILKDEKSALTNQTTALLNQTAALTNQTATLQTQLNTLQSSSQNMQTIINNLNNETDTLQLQLADLQVTNNALQKKNDTTSLFMYLSTGVAVAFVAATACIVMRGRKSNSKEKSLF